MSAHEALQTNFWFSREESDGSHLVISRFGKVLRLNSSAFEILRVLDRTRARSAASMSIASEFGIDAELARKSVDSVIASLTIAGIVADNEDS